MQLKDLWSFKTPGTTDPATQHHIPRDVNLQQHHCENLKTCTCTFFSHGPGWHSRYSDMLQAGWPGDRILVGVRFSVPLQTGPKAHPAPYTMGTGSFPGVKHPGRGTDHPPYSTEAKERAELHLYSPFGPLWPVLG